MSYDLNELQRRLQTGEFRKLGLEAVHQYLAADEIFDSDPDFVCMIVAMGADGFMPLLSRPQIRALVALVLAAQQRLLNAPPDGQPALENPGQEVGEIPVAFREALQGLDLDTL